MCLIKIEISKEDVLVYKKLEVISQIALVKAKIELFESKYSCKFEDFEKKIRTEGKENFEEWNDYIEWKAYRTLKELERKLKEIDNAKVIRIA